MSNMKIFKDLFGKQFQYEDNKMNEDELNLSNNLGSKWTLISIFNNDYKFLIDHLIQLLQEEFPAKDLLRHDNPKMTLLIYNGLLSDSQAKLVQKIKDNSVSEDE